jgi:hypothetical protein
MQQDRRGKLGYEALILIVLTFAGWASTAGMMWQHLNDLDARVQRLESKIDIVVNSVTGEKR